MSRLRPLLTPALVAAAVALTGACGHTQVVGADRTLQLALTEYRMTPQSVRLSAGPLTIFVHNYGRLTHNLVVTFDGRPAAATQPIWPGQGAELTLALSPGKYVMASTLLSDQALGEYGTLTVTT